MRTLDNFFGMTDKSPALLLSCAQIHTQENTLRPNLALELSGCRGSAKFEFYGPFVMIQSLLTLVSQLIGRNKILIILLVNFNILIKNIKQRFFFHLQFLLQ